MNGSTTERRGLSEARLDEMRLRLLGADHRPWELSDPNLVDMEGRRMVIRCSGSASRRARKRATLPPEDGFPDGGFDRDVLAEELCLFRRTNHVTDDALEFIAHAPKDIEDLLAEVVGLRTAFDRVMGERDRAVKELLSARAQLTQAEETLVDAKRAWRSLNKELGR